MSNRTRIGVSVTKMYDSQWSLAIGVSHWGDETYLYLNLIKWTVTVGRIYD